MVRAPPMGSAVRPGARSGGSAHVCSWVVVRPCQQGVRHSPRAGPLAGRLPGCGARHPSAPPSPLRRCGTEHHASARHPTPGSKGIANLPGDALGSLCFCPISRPTTVPRLHAGMIPAQQWSGIRCAPCAQKATPLNPLAQPMLPSRERPLVELDDSGAFVPLSAHNVWIGRARERQTRSIVGIAGGDRTDETCRQGGTAPPAAAGKRASSSPDGFTRSAAVFPNKRQRLVGKATGATAPIERCPPTLHQRRAGVVRTTRSFRRDQLLHYTCSRMVSAASNARCSVACEPLPPV